MTVIRSVLHGSRDHVTRELLAVDPRWMAHPVDPSQMPDSVWNDVKAVALAIAVLLVIVTLASWVPTP